MLLYPYKAGSKSVKALAATLPAKIVKLNNSKLKGNPKKTVINWGSSEIDDAEVNKCRVLNHPKHVAIATNKLSFFKLVSALEVTPLWTEEIEVAKSWLPKSLVVGRSILNGHSGAGIHIFDSPQDVVKLPLYVKYVKKQLEYRVHVFNGKTIDIQRKARDKEVPDAEVNWLVRNHKNGFIYAREGVDTDPLATRLSDLAVLVVAHCHLDFGAVDIIYNEKADKLYVLEINTAPGLEGTTLEKYAAAIKELM